MEGQEREATNLEKFMAGVVVIVVLVIAYFILSGLFSFVAGIFNFWYSRVYPRRDKRKDRRIFI